MNNKTLLSDALNTHQTLVNILTVGNHRFSGDVTMRLVQLSRELGEIDDAFINARDALLKQHDLTLADLKAENPNLKGEIKEFNIAFAQLITLEIDMPKLGLSSEQLIASMKATKLTSKEADFFLYLADDFGKTKKTTYNFLPEQTVTDTPLNVTA